MVFKINGTDITPYIASGGLQWSRNDLDGPNAGRALDGFMYRDRVATKGRWDITCRPLLSTELSQLLSLIQDEYFTVLTIDPITNQERTYQAYSNNIPAKYLMIINGKEYWSGVTFPVIER